MKMNNICKALCVIVLLSGLSFKPAPRLKTSKSVKLSNVKGKDLTFKNIEFDFNKATIRKSSQAELDRVQAKLSETNASLKVSGHADSRGTYLANWKLSQARAESVKAYLVSKGYEQSRIAATEFGDTKPIASNKTAAGRQKNRRVELKAY